MIQDIIQKTSHMFPNNVQRLNISPKAAQLSSLRDNLEISFQLLSRTQRHLTARPETNLERLPIFHAQIKSTQNFSQVDKLFFSKYYLSMRPNIINIVLRKIYLQTHWPNLARHIVVGLWEANSCFKKFERMRDKINQK